MAKRLVAITVRSQPTGANVFVDGELRASAPTTIETPVGSELTVSAQMPGYRSAATTVFAARDAALDFVLQAIST